MPGPPPNPNRRRRNATVAMTQLPAEGRQGEPPAWPLGTADEAEAALWADLWATPQAVAWERLRYGREVALYVRWQLLAETGQTEAAKEARFWSDRLGLNPVAMLRLRWEIAADELGDQRADRTARTSAATSRSRRGLKAVDASS